MSSAFMADPFRCTRCIGKMKDVAEPLSVNEANAIDKILLEFNQPVIVDRTKLAYILAEETSVVPV
jgi:hypothetical protein